MNSRRKTIINELEDEWNMHSAGDLYICLGDINGHFGRHIDGFMEGMQVGQWNLEGRKLLEICLEKEICVSNIWFNREEKRKVTFRMGGNETKIDFACENKDKFVERCKDQDAILRESNQISTQRSVKFVGPFQGWGLKCM